MTTFKQFRNQTKEPQVRTENIDGSAEEKVVRKQQSINNIIAAYRTGKLDRSSANQKLRQKGHQGLTEGEAKDKHWICTPQSKTGMPMSPSMRGCGHVWSAKYKPSICPECLNPLTDIKQHKAVKEEIITEAPRREKKSLKIFRGARTATGQKPNPIDTDPKLKLNKTVNAMAHKGY